MSEKQSTGITKILRELQKNGSPKPEFETDEDRTYLITTIRCREGFVHGRIDGRINGRITGRIVRSPCISSISRSPTRRRRTCR
ncbi:MAG: hypothetical protein LUF30_07540 [Lachnospiraceae bacterium]|nr:hypothetical protein [Lachnospiraceae bacterium]